MTFSTRAGPARGFATARIVQKHVLSSALLNHFLSLQPKTGRNLVEHHRKPLAVLVDEAENLIILPNLWST
eukprot:SAG22_NODE_3563_length_1640_cov_1.887735_2_plen_71_part_01